MNCQEIKNYTLKKTGLNTIPDAYLIDYINEIMDSLVVDTDSAGKKKPITIDAISGEWIDLPVDYVAIKRCIRAENNQVYDDFLIENNQIQFKISGEYRVEYITMQDHVLSLEDTPPINIIFHETLALGASYKEAARIFMYDNNNIKAQLFSEYMEERNKAIKKATNTKRSRRRIQYADFF